MDRMAHGLSSIVVVAFSLETAIRGIGDEIHFLRCEIALVLMILYRPDVLRTAHAYMYTKKMPIFGKCFFDQVTHLEQGVANNAGRVFVVPPLTFTVSRYEVKLPGLRCTSLILDGGQKRQWEFNHTCTCWWFA